MAKPPVPREKFDKMITHVKQGVSLCIACRLEGVSTQHLYNVKAGWPGMSEEMLERQRILIEAESNCFARAERALCKLCIDDPKLLLAWLSKRDLTKDKIYKEQQQAQNTFNFDLSDRDKEYIGQAVQDIENQLGDKE